MSQEHDVAALHLYAYRSDNDGPYFIGNPRTVDDGISLAAGALKDCRRRFTRAEIKDVRADAVVWASDRSV
jgi:hypothetical protein